MNKDDQLIFEAYRGSSSVVKGILEWAFESGWFKKHRIKAKVTGLEHPVEIMNLKKHQKGDLVTIEKGIDIMDIPLTSVLKVDKETEDEYERSTAIDVEPDEKPIARIPGGELGNPPLQTP